MEIIAQIMDTAAEGGVKLSAAWVIGTFGTMAVTITTLAGIIYNSLLKRIESQQRIIENLQEDVKRLSKGCGMSDCHFLKRE